MEFIFFESPERAGAFIMQFSPPYFWGQVYKFKTASELQDFTADAVAQRGVIVRTIYPYTHHICIVQRGSLIPRIPGTHADVETIYRQMGDYFYQHKILNHEAYYKKFRADP